MMPTSRETAECLPGLEWPPLWECQCNCGGRKVVRRDRGQAQLAPHEIRVADDPQDRWLARTDRRRTEAEDVQRQVGAGGGRAVPLGEDVDGRRPAAHETDLV